MTKRCFMKAFGMHLRNSSFQVNHDRNRFVKVEDFASTRPDYPCFATFRLKSCEESRRRSI